MLYVIENPFHKNERDFFIPYISYRHKMSHV